MSQTCPSGHNLESAHTAFTGLTYECDECGARDIRSTLRCRTCDYDRCTLCQAKASTSPTPSIQDKYIASLEAQVADLQKRNQRLEAQVEAAAAVMAGRKDGLLAQLLDRMVDPPPPIPQPAQPLRPEEMQGARFSPYPAGMK
jgi:hypothetical protein